MNVSSKGSRTSAAKEESVGSGIDWPASNTEAPEPAQKSKKGKGTARIVRNDLDGGSGADNLDAGSDAV